ncbi:MAG: hypothetical protein KJO44_06220 [Gemmatimonadetes bacterium]|nr:hypothetical protein [Gemmatimonadota bacterium]
MLRRLIRAVDLRDLLALAGLALASYGSFLMYPPVGLVVGGLGLWYLGTWHQLLAARSIPFQPESTTDSG